MKRSQRAQQAWQVLAGAAANRQTITYEMLADRTGVVRFGFAQVLGCVAFYCEHNQLPPLTVLVVGRDGKPESGLLDILGADKLDLHREEVFAHPWDRMLPPGADALEAALVFGMKARQMAVPPDDIEPMETPG